MKLSNTPYLVPNVVYSLDYTITTQQSAQTVVDITTPSFTLRVNAFALNLSSSDAQNWAIAIRINNVPFIYPSGTSEFNNPPASYTLIGNVPTDYMDLPANSRIQILAYMNGTATANGTLNFSLSGKPVIEGGD